MEKNRVIQSFDDDVFKFLDPKANDQLSELKGLDLQDLIVLIDDLYIQYRNKLGIDENITFGFELEFENASKDRIENKLIELFPNREYRTKHDGSLNNGAEICTPVLIDRDSDWQNFDKVCKVVNPHASIGTRSGGHIHVGSQILGDDKEAWLNFIKLWSVYENIIFRFAYGEFLTARPSLDDFAEPMTKDFWRDYNYLKQMPLESLNVENIIYLINHRRYQAVNFGNVRTDRVNQIGDKNTIEFRCPNGSLNPIIWQNNVNLFIKMLLYSKSFTFDNDTVMKRYKIKSDNYSKIALYDEIFLDQALEFCDMVFTNNLDKVYFLRQYLKSWEINKPKSSRIFPKARELTKKR